MAWYDSKIHDKDDEEVIFAVLNHFKNKNSGYFFNDIEKFICPSKKCIKIKGDYIEKRKMVVSFYRLFLYP